MGDWLSARQAARALGVSPQTISLWCREGRIRHTRLSDKPQSRIRIRRKWLEEFELANTAGGRAPVAASVGD